MERVVSGPGPQCQGRTCCPLSVQEEMQSNVEVVHTYRQHIMNDMNPGNLHLFINAYNRYGCHTATWPPCIPGASCRARTRVGGERDHAISREYSPRI